VKLDKQKTIGMTLATLSDSPQHQSRGLRVLHFLLPSMQPLMALLSSTSMICNEVSIPLLPTLNMNKIKLPISDKESIRAEIKRGTSLLNKEEKEQAAKVVCEKLLALVVVQESTNIILYEALTDEISLKYFIEEIYKQSKNSITITPSGNYNNLPEE